MSRRRPSVVFEVLSRSTRDFDRLRRIEECHALPSLRHLVFLEAKTPTAVHRLQGGDGDGEWEEKQVHGIMGSLHLDAIGVIILMADIYEGLSFD